MKAPTRPQRTTARLTTLRPRTALLRMMLLASGGPARSWNRASECCPRRTRFERPALQSGRSGPWLREWQSFPLASRGQEQASRPRAPPWRGCSETLLQLATPAWPPSCCSRVASTIARGAFGCGRWRLRALLLEPRVALRSKAPVPPPAVGRTQASSATPHRRRACCRLASKRTRAAPLAAAPPPCRAKAVARPAASRRVAPKRRQAEHVTAGCIVLVASLRACAWSVQGRCQCTAGGSRTRRAARGPGTLPAAAATARPRSQTWPRWQFAARRASLRSA